MKKDNTMEIRKTLEKLDTLETIGRDKISDSKRIQTREQLESHLRKIDKR